MFFEFRSCNFERIKNTSLSIKLQKVEKSQAPQDFSGCLDIDNDEINQNKVYPLGWPQPSKVLCTTVLSDGYKKNVVAQKWYFQTSKWPLNQNLKIKLSLKFYHQGPRISTFY